MKTEQRIENFEQIRANLEGAGYTATPRTLSVFQANLWALVITLPIAIFCFILFFNLHRMAELIFSFYQPLLWVAVLFVCFVVHECIHGLTWAFFCKNGLKSVYIGMMWKKLTPFCCCMEPLRTGPYLLGGLMPFIVLGVCMFGVALASGSVFLLGLSVMNIMGAGGDLAIALMLRQHRGAWTMDHPTECGFWAFQKEKTGQ